MKITELSKKNLIVAIVAFIFISIISSCTDETPVSPTGDDRDLFTGTWTCSENSKLNGPSAYTVNISKFGENDTVTIKNFYELGNSTFTYGFVFGNGITIPSQNVTGFIINGSGVLSNNKINLTYYALDGSLKDTVTAVYSQ